MLWNHPVLIYLSKGNPTETGFSFIFSQNSKQVSITTHSQTNLKYQKFGFFYVCIRTFNQQSIGGAI